MVDNETGPEGRSAPVAKELERCRVDVAALQETRMEGQGMIQECNDTYYWSGNPEAGEKLECPLQLPIKSRPNCHRSRQAFSRD